MLQKNKNNTYKSENDKTTSSSPLVQNPENFLFFTGIVLFWLYWNHDIILSWKYPPITMLFWWSIVILSIIAAISIYFYIKYILADVFLKAGNLSQEALIKKLKGFIKWSFVFWILTAGTIAITKLLYLFISYYFLEKLYIRIIKRVDYKNETAEQKYQIFRNNVLLFFFFPIWYIITIFTSQIVTYIFTTCYLAIILIWHNRWPGFYPEEYTITKAPVGSEERFALLKEALGAVEDDESITAHEDDWDTALEEETDDREEYNPDFVMSVFDEEKKSEYDLEEIKLEIERKKNYQMYFKDKIYPVHEYYLWWLMRDVPLYFTIKAFFHMFLDILSWIIRFILLVPLLALSYFATALPFGVPICNQLFWLFIILFISLTVPTGWLGLSSIHVYYSWFAFFNREEAYATIDDIHSYAMTGPTVDGPHTWQYWFYVFFSYFPSRALVLQQQVFDEEIRLAEIEIELSIDFMEIMDDEENTATVKVDIWNPMDLIWLRNASEEEVKRYKKRLKEQEHLKVEQEIIDDWKQTLNYETPHWWRHYYM